MKSRHLQSVSASLLWGRCSCNQLCFQIARFSLCHTDVNQHGRAEGALACSPVQLSHLDLSFLVWRRRGSEKDGFLTYLMRSNFLLLRCLPWAAGDSTATDSKDMGSRRKLRRQCTAFKSHSLVLNQLNLTPRSGDWSQAPQPTEVSFYAPVR